MKTSILACSLLLLTGCAGRPGGFSEAMKYDQTVHKVQTADGVWRVFEHPSGTKIMTTPSLDMAFGSGLVQGATLGLAETLPHEQRHEAAARKRLDETGRQHCKITSGYELIKGQYEFTYDCSAEEPRPIP